MRRQLQNILIQRRHPYSRLHPENRTSWGLRFFQNRKQRFSFQKVYPQGAHILSAGEEKQGGLWVTQPCFFFFLEWTRGQRNGCDKNFKEAPPGRTKQENAKVEVFALTAGFQS